MMNVSCNRLLIAFLALSTLLLAGCKEPEVSMAQLGRKMAAPQLKGASPFDQDFDVNKYVRLQGTCDIRVGEVSVSFDNQNWHSIAALPTYAGTTLSGSETNDAVCLGDGTFDFYVTESEMTSWGISPNSDVDYIYIRGSTLIGDTQTLTLKDPKIGNGGGKPASQVFLQKTWPEGFAGSGRCESFNVSVRDENGNYASSSNAVAFTLDKEVASTITPKIAAYTSYEDCSTGTNSKAAFSIPANQNHLAIWYRFPDAPIDGVISFRANEVALATPTSAFTAVTLRDGSQATRFWLTTHSHSRFRPNTCNPIQFDARYYNGTEKYLSGSDSIGLTVTGTNSSLLHFYSDATCTTSISSVSAYATDKKFYFKYKGTEVTGDILTLTITHSLSTYSAGTFDDVPQRIEIDRSSGNNTVTHVDLSGSNILTRGSCTRMSVSSYNNRGALLGAGNLVNITPARASSKFFTSFSDCDIQANEVTSVTMTSGTVDVWFRPTQVPGTMEQVNIAAAGLTTRTQSFTIDPRPTAIMLLLNSSPADMPYIGTQCLPITIEAKLMDYLGDYYYSNPTSSPLIITTQVPSGYTIYSDAACSSALAASMGMSISPSATSTGIFNYYLKADSTPMVNSFYASLMSPVGTISYLSQGTVTVVPQP